MCGEGEGCARSRPAAQTPRGAPGGKDDRPSGLSRRRFPASSTKGGVSTSPGGIGIALALGTALSRPVPGTSPRGRRFSGREVFSRSEASFAFGARWARSRPGRAVAWSRASKQGETCPLLHACAFFEEPIFKNPDPGRLSHPVAAPVCETNGCRWLSVSLMPGLWGARRGESGLHTCVASTGPLWAEAAL